MCTIEKLDVDNLGSNLKVKDVLIELRTMRNSFIDCIHNIYSELEDIKASANGHEQKLNKLENEIIPKVDKNIDTSVTAMDNKLVSLQAHGRRLNIIINGIPESKNEDTEAEVKKILVETIKLPVQTVSNILVRDCHRLPKGKNSIHKPIICAFIQQKHRNEVLSKAYSRGRR